MLEICTAGLEFESGLASLVRVWNSRGFIHSPGPIKYVFWKIEFPRIQNKKDNIIRVNNFDSLKQMINFTF